MVLLRRRIQEARWKKQLDGSYILTTKDQYTYGFNADGYLCWMKDNNGNTISITVDSYGQVTQVTDQVGRTTTIAYNQDDLISTITDPAGRVVTYSYDNYQLCEVVDPNGNSTYYDYELGLLSEISDDNQNLIEGVTYDDNSSTYTWRVETLTDIYGNVTTYSYDDSDGMLTTVDSNGRTNNTWYDKMLYPIRTRDAEGKETRTTYNLIGGLNQYGEVVSYTDRNGNTMYYDRDAEGNIIRQVNPDGSEKEYTYDAKNNVLSIQDEVGHFTYYIYDANDINLIKQVQPLNGTDVYSEVAPQENFAITEYSYYTGAEALSLFGATIYGLIESTTDAEGNVTTYTYDEYGSVETVESPESNTTVYDYNVLGWLIIRLQIQKDILQTYYYYDKNGNVAERRSILETGSVSRNVL